MLVYDSKYSISQCCRYSLCSGTHPYSISSLIIFTGPSLACSSFRYSFTSGTSTDVPAHFPGWNNNIFGCSNFICNKYKVILFIKGNYVIFIGMGKYIITESQLKTAIYAVLDSQFNGYTNQEFEEWVTWMETKYIHIGNEEIQHTEYYTTETEEGRSIVFFSKKLGEKLSKTFKIRMSKVVDIVGDYVEEVHNLPVDEVEIRKDS